MQNLTFIGKSYYFQTTFPFLVQDIKDLLFLGQSIN